MKSINIHQKLQQSCKHHTYINVKRDKDIINGKFSGGEYTGRIRRGIHPETKEVSCGADGIGRWTYHVSGEKRIVYDGEWKRNSACGYGICSITYIDGRQSTYKGQWSENKHHGKGEHIEKDKDGKIIIRQIGEFSKGKFVEPVSLSDTSAI